MRKTLRGKYVVVSTKMRSNSVYSEGADWEKQGLDPGFNFFLCLREKEVVFSSFFFPGWPQVKRADWYQSAFSTGGQTEPKRKARKKTGKKACNGRGPIPTCEEHVGKNKVWNV